MSWIQKLYDTYEACESMVDVVNTDNEIPLLPICHTTQKAQIEIVIDGNGSFKRAVVIPKNEARTIIPCTESSGGRTSGMSPHPLCDKLQYIAGDYKKFGGNKESCFSISEFPYNSNEIEQEYFEIELSEIQKNDKYKLIAEIASDQKKHKAIDLMNDLISIFNMIEILNSNQKMLKIDKKNCDDGTIIKNKYKLLDLFPRTLEKTITYNYLLNKWSTSQFSHPKVKAVLQYIEKNNIIDDLIKEKILYVDDSNILLNQWNGDKKNTPEIFLLLPGKFDEKKGEWINWQAEAFVRWRVEIPHVQETAVWKDKSLIDCWIDYYSKTKCEKSLCYVMGEKIPSADQHPAKIRNDGDKAKLISSNDISGYTFRGRFLNSSQACDVGFEVTQKAHNALRWLIARQGYRKADQAIVAWAISGNDIPNMMADTLSLTGEDDLPEDEPSLIYTAQDFGIKLKKKISGYKQKLNDPKGIVVLGLDSVTPGRMAITFYRELTNSDFLSRIENWHTSCAWFHYYRTKEIIENKTGKKKIVQFRFDGAPAPDDIALAAHGHYENEIFKVDDKLRKSIVERLLPCIIDGQKIPRDLVLSATRKASNRIGFKKDSDWSKTLSIACALYRKYHEKEDYKMALEENRTKRDYLYGRLLALADSLEQWALYKSGDKRQTSAARLMQRFADHPYSTWRTVELSLVPYKARLGGISTNRQRLIDKVKNMFETVEDFQNDKPLSGEFLLAYSCQKEALREATRMSKLAKEKQTTVSAIVDDDTDDIDEDYNE